MDCRIRHALLGLLLLMLLPWCAARATDYSLMSWRYGVVVWPGELNTYLSVPERFIERLEAAAEEAFGFWGHDPPVAADDWPSAVRLDGRLRIEGPFDVGIVDDATGQEMAVPNLVWQGDRLSPLLVIPFVGHWRMYDALGATATFGAQFFYRPLVRTYPNAEPWVHEVGLGYRAMICVSHAGDDVLVHEFTHWFQWTWCEVRGLEPLAMPTFIREGMAEAIGADVEVSPHAAWNRQAVLDWAADKCLAGGVGAAAKYTVGESLVEYLIGKLGALGFLATLADWIRAPYMMIVEHEPGWRESLGLPAACPDRSDEEHGG
jgi:hypothetical protein